MYSPSRAISQGHTHIHKMVTYYGGIRVDFMHVGMAWVHPWLIALEGEYSHKIDPYMVVCMLLHNGQFMHVGVAWVCPWLIALEGEYIRSTLIIIVVCMLLYKGQFYVLYISSIRICVTNVVLVQGSEIYFSFSFN